MYARCFSLIKIYVYVLLFSFMQKPTAQHSFSDNKKKRKKETPNNNYNMFGEKKRIYLRKKVYRVFTLLRDSAQWCDFRGRYIALSVVWALPDFPPFNSSHNLCFLLSFIFTQCQISVNCNTKKRQK